MLCTPMGALKVRGVINHVGSCMHTQLLTLVEAAEIAILFVYFVDIFLMGIKP